MLFYQISILLKWSPRLQHIIYNNNTVVRPDTIKLLEENIGRTLFDINCSNILLDLSPRVMEITTIINKWDLIKLKSFCTGKETNKQNEKTNLQNGRKYLQMKQPTRD